MNLIKKCARWVMRLMLRLRLLKFFPRNPGVLECHTGTAPQNTRRLCIFAGYSRDGGVADYVLHNLRALEASGFDIIFVTTAAVLRPEDLERLKPLCLRVIRRQNTGYDFGSWKAGLFYAGIDLKNYDQLLLTNDSYYGPLGTWKEVLATADSDLYGITDSYGIKYHLMSYFVLYDKRVLHAPEFTRYWRDVRMIPTILKTLIIYAYEVGLSQKFQADGFSVKAYCAEKDLLRKLPGQEHLLGQTIVVHRFWRELIELMRCPILKVDTFWRVLDPTGDQSWIEVLQKAGYDVDLILRHRKK